MIYCIVSFVWDDIRGKGIVCHGSTCHGHPVTEDDLRIEITELQSPRVLHPVYQKELEVQSYTVILKHRLTNE